MFVRRRLVPSGPWGRDATEKRRHVTRPYLIFPPTPIQLTFLLANRDKNVPITKGREQHRFCPIVSMCHLVCLPSSTKKKGPMPLVSRSNDTNCVTAVHLRGAKVGFS